MPDRPMTPREQNVWDMMFVLSQGRVCPGLEADEAVEAYRTHLAEHPPAVDVEPLRGRLLAAVEIWREWRKWTAGHPISSAELQLSDARDTYRSQLQKAERGGGDA